MTTLRYEVEIAEVGRPPLPPLPLPPDVTWLIGSRVDAHVRLPLGTAAPIHCELGPGPIGATASGNRLQLAPSSAAASVECNGLLVTGSQLVDLPCTLAIGNYRLTFRAAGQSQVVSPARTASLARELARNLLGGASAPSVTLQAWPGSNGNTVLRELPPPPSRITIGRGDDADWQIADPDLSRLHLAIERGWDGVRVVDLDSKNGTLVNGQAIDVQGVALLPGADLKAGGCVWTYDDPAARLQGESVAALGVVPSAGLNAATEPAARVSATSALEASGSMQRPLPSVGAPAVGASGDLRPLPSAVFWLACGIGVTALASIVWLWI